MESTEASQLLESVDQLSRTTRAARRGYWFPLVLFGLIILGTLIFTQPPGPAPAVCPAGQELVALPIGHEACRGAGSTIDSLIQGFGTPADAAHPWGLGLFWILAVPLGFVGTMVFYRLRGRTKGVESRVWPYVVFGLVLFVFLWITSPSTVYALHLPQWMASWRSRPYLIGLSAYGMAPVLVIAFGLFVLARLERSRTLWAIAVAFLGVATAANFYNISNAFYRLHHWIVPDWAANAAVAGGFLVFCGAMAWLAGRRQTA